jgi:HSP20 family protein
MSGRRDPFEEMERIFDRLSRRFDEMGREFEEAVEESPLPTSPTDAPELPSAPTPAALARGTARLDIVDDGDAYVVTVDLPGFERDDVELRLRDGQLQIEGSRETVSEAGDETYVRRERSRRSVARTVALPGPVVADEASATHENGVLTVRLPKVDEDEAGRRIDVE